VQIDVWVRVSRQRIDGVPVLQGNAILFYNVMEDGNVDDRALHAALPVNKGEKWCAPSLVYPIVPNTMLTLPFLCSSAGSLMSGSGTLRLAAPTMTCNNM
jgi:hypothetical protein